jgi:hypothetical protein
MQKTTHVITVKNQEYTANANKMRVACRKLKTDAGCTKVSRETKLLHVLQNKHIQIIQSTAKQQQQCFVQYCK